MSEKTSKARRSRSATLSTSLLNRVADVGRNWQQVGRKSATDNGKRHASSSSSSANCSPTLTHSYSHSHSLALALTPHSLCVLALSSMLVAGSWLPSCPTPSHTYTHTLSHFMLSSLWATLTPKQTKQI